jgi:hypothetical protein
MKIFGMMNMKIDRLKALGTIVFMVLIGTEFFQPQLVQARTMPLSDCRGIIIKGEASNWGWTAGFSENKEDFMLGREIYTSLFKFYSDQDQEFSCKLPNAKSASLDLEMAIGSNRNGPFLVTIYLNGNQISSEKVFPGKITVVRETLTGRSDAPYQVGGRPTTLVFQTTCLNGSGCGAVRFLKGNFNFAANPGRNE